MNGRLVDNPKAMVDTPATSMKISAVAALSESSSLTKSEASAAAAEGERLWRRCHHMGEDRGSVTTFLPAPSQISTNRKALDLRFNFGTVGP